MTVNIENIDKVIAMIENEKNFFAMSHWDRGHIGGLKDYPENVCGTPACIGGWAEAIMMFEAGLPKTTSLPSNWQNVAEWLGLDRDQGNDLFYPANEGINASREQALAHLRYIRDEGDVDWERFAPDLEEDETTY